MWNNIVKDLAGDVSLTVYEDRSKKTYNFFVNNSIGIDVIDIDQTNLNFGLDIKGGTRVILSPKGNVTKETVDEIIATLQTRVNTYGLKEINIIPVRSFDGNYYIQIEAAGVGRDIVENLLSKQGRFEAKITKPVFLKDNKGVFQLSNSYNIELLSNDSVKLGDMFIDVNQTFSIEDIEFQYLNRSGSELMFWGTAYKGEDIELVYSDPQHSGIIPSGDYYQFYFVVMVSETGAGKFAKITSGIPSQIDMQSGEEYLKDSKIYLFLDDQLVSDLRISSELGGKVYTTPQVTGSRETQELALEEKLNLQSILRSGSLPVSLEVASISVISPTLGQGFITSALFAGVLAAIAVIIIVFVRYRNLKIAVPMVFMTLSEVIIIVGVAAGGDSIIWIFVLLLNMIIVGTAWWKKEEIDITAWIGAFLIPLFGFLSWTLDLPAIGGIIAAIGTGVDHLVIIADETMLGKREEAVYTFKEKIKRAFFIIFGTAAATISAMVPMIFIGIGLIKGFAITTTVGVLIGVLVTRPAYAVIAERMKK
jgi:preprotein translocase subunit SecD